MCKPGEIEFYDLWLVLVKWVKMFGIEIKYVMLSSKGNLELLTPLVQIFLSLLNFWDVFLILVAAGRKTCCIVALSVFYAIHYFQRILFV